MAKETFTTRDRRNSAQILMSETRKHPHLGQLSSMTLTLAGPGMKSSRSSTPEPRRWRHPPPATTGAVCSNIGANTLLQAAQSRQRARRPIYTELPIISTTHGVTPWVILVFPFQEIGTRLPFTQSTTDANQETSKSNFLSPHHQTRTLAYCKTTRKKWVGYLKSIIE